MSILSSAEMIDLLRRRSHGKQAALAFEAGVSEAHVSRVLGGKQPPGPKLLGLIGLRKVSGYEAIQ